ncbi:lipopolysaccharide transport system permease protein [Neorhizobium huautlense]|uniref:Transport permease protein n=1 Tax=Neorhizobium huautlense TaxID=67774 RepID=A0ABT9Q3N9_9HYPH|nr:ABC transporter permease [Neorhizobium huautlense]MDP9840709.1 lipopolysaccharide transport system permease protein [Neorhizobium huautlense]
MFMTLRAIYRNRTLILRLARRETEARFRGSFLGILWVTIVPVTMLLIYSIVFGSILKSGWRGPQGDETSRFSFPMLLFIGLTLFGILSETINRSPSLILENKSYVKKVSFPLEILPVVALLSTLINAGISFLIFMVFYVLLYGLPPHTIAYLPFVIFPFAILCLGIAYFLASLGVFLRDLKHITGPFTTAILFLSPVFYSIQTLPEQYRYLMYLNPMTPVVNQARDVIFWGAPPAIVEWLVMFSASFLVYLLGSAWFSRTQKAFADVI